MAEIRRLKKPRTSARIQRKRAADSSADHARPSSRICRVQDKHSELQRPATVVHGGAFVSNAGCQQLEPGGIDRPFERRPQQYIHNVLNGNPEDIGRDLQLAPARRARGPKTQRVPTCAAYIDSTTIFEGRHMSERLWELDEDQLLSKLSTGLQGRMSEDEVDEEHPVVAPESPSLRPWLDYRSTKSWKNILKTDVVAWEKVTEETVSDMHCCSWCGVVEFGCANFHSCHSWSQVFTAKMPPSFLARPTLRTFMVASKGRFWKCAACKADLAQQMQHTSIFSDATIAKYMKVPSVLLQSMSCLDASLKDFRMMPPGPKETKPQMSRWPGKAEEADQIFFLEALVALSMIASFSLWPCLMAKLGSICLPA